MTAAEAIPVSEQMATKTDLSAVKADLKADIAALRAEFKQ